MKFSDPFQDRKVEMVYPFMYLMNEARKMISILQDNKDEIPEMEHWTQKKDFILKVPKKSCSFLHPKGYQSFELVSMELLSCYVF